MDVSEHNRDAWDNEVNSKNPWTIPVSHEEIEKAKQGEWQIVLTPTIPVPSDWLLPMQGCKVLCLASGGGQQGPILAAAGADVTVIDNSPRQLESDRMVAERENLTVNTVLGDMRNLSTFADETFDLIVHPVSNCFIPDVNPVWREAWRVLKPGGRLLSGFTNPLMYAMDWNLYDKDKTIQLKHAIPYSDLETLSEEEKEKYQREKIPYEFGHSLNDQIGGQIAAGFIITGFYEDIDPGEKYSELLPVFIATCAEKLIWEDEDDHEE